MARLELERGTDVLLLERGDALLLEGFAIIVTPTTLALVITTYKPDLIRLGDLGIVTKSKLSDYGTATKSKLSDYETWGI